MSGLKSKQPASFKIRPRFEVQTEYAVDEVLQLINTAIVKEESILAKVSEDHVTLYIKEDQQHYWSPELSISIYENETGSTLQGIYGPRPAVWTMFVFFYAIIGFAILIVALFGFTSRSLGNPAPILWLIPILSVVFLSFYLTSYFGQKLGHKEIELLHDFVENSIGMKI